MENVEQKIIETLDAVWFGIDWDSYSQSMIKNIYPFFASRIRASANQSATYERFAELLIRRMKSTTSSIPVKINNEKEFLRRCRDETSYLIALFRQGVCEKQEERKTRKEQKDKDMEGLPF